VFDRAVRSPQVVFNEKVLCGLGRGVASTGALDAASMEHAHANIERFVGLARTMGVGTIDAVATAAVRDAANGIAFVREIRRRTGLKARIVSGEDEARLSAEGVISAIPEADGIVGDLGGGSLELIQVRSGRSLLQATLPLGPLRLMGLSRGDIRRARGLVDGELDRHPWLSSMADREFYCVGGAWRSLARAHMGMTDYPLKVIHQYAIDLDEALDFLKRLPRISRTNLGKIPGVFRRLDAVSWATLVLHRVLARGRPERVVFSAYGLREGCLYRRLTAAQRQADPLLAACQDLAESVGRFGPQAESLRNFVEPAIPARRTLPDRLCEAACLLGDIAWQEHPDYRPMHGFYRVLRLPVVGVDHAERAFLSLAVLARYSGRHDPELLAPIAPLIEPRRRRQALILGLALRLAFTLSGGATSVLRDLRLTPSPRGLAMELPRKWAHLFGDVAVRRLDALAAALNRRAEVVAR
jgi:exopolyphosphatase/guanosine-5'-triphosphate,3'-diphosphate pyrophosphatase